MNEAETSSLWLLFIEYTLREKYLCLEFFWSVFSCIWNELQIYSVNTRIQSKCTKIQTRKSPNTDNFHLVIIIPLCIVFIFTQHVITHISCRISLHCIFFLLDKQKSWRWAKVFRPKRNKMKKDSEIDEKKKCGSTFSSNLYFFVIYLSSNLPNWTTLSTNECHNKLCTENKTTVIHLSVGYLS